MRKLKLIVEDNTKSFADNCTVTLVEGEQLDENGQPKMPQIYGPMIETEAVNRNGRVYPKQMMEDCVKQYIADRIKPGKYRSYGELGHPEGVEINLHRWSHYITELNWNGNLVMGKAQLVPTEYGRVAETMFRCGMEMGVSSRGLGALDESRMIERNGEAGNLVTEYELVAVDIVADPSAPKGFVEGIMEGREYVIQGGKYTEASLRRSVEAYENLEKSLKDLPKKEVDSYILGKLEDFFKTL